jgi:hypothetical protein
MSEIITITKKVRTFLQTPLFTIPIPTAVPEKPKATTSPEIIMMPVRRKPTSVIIHKNRNKDDFEKILFVLKAREQNSGRGFTEVLHIEKSENEITAVASDGKRMHIAKLNMNIRSGDYKPIISGDMIKLGQPVKNIMFPEWRKAIPTMVTKKGFLYPNDFIQGKINLSNVVKRLTGENINPDFLASLPQKVWVVYSQTEKRKAVILRELGAERERYTVIMPTTS